jgi:tRNA pseudouridine55 synthase
MDGLLLIDKPAGPTSHDVVARMRRVLGERRIGHTGTLDPAATGVLPLVIGRATRLARFMSASDKSYEALVRLGVCTDTADGEGQPIGEGYEGPMPSREAIDAALDAFRGSFLQQPPAFSAKRIAGKRSYALARSRIGVGSGPDRDQAEVKSESEGLPALPEPVTVTAHAIELMMVEAGMVALRVDCSAGFYVRSLARDLGERLGTGAHLAALRRTRSADFGLDQTIGLEAGERDPLQAAAAVIPLGHLLTGLASVVLTPEGLRYAVHGRELGPSHWRRDSGFGIRDSWDHAATVDRAVFSSPAVRLLDERGELVGLARPGSRSGSLHPFVVLM